MTHLPAHIKLHRNEQVVAVIRPDLEIRLLRAALIAVVSLIMVLLFLIGLDIAMGRPLRGISAGLLLTFAFMVSPLLAQRIMSPRPVHVLTSQRLIVDQETAFPLQAITRLQVWLTGLCLDAMGRRIHLQHLANPAAVARLIRDTIANPGRI